MSDEMKRTDIGDLLYDAFYDDDPRMLDKIEPMLRSLWNRSGRMRRAYMAEAISRSCSREDNEEKEIDDIDRFVAMFKVLLFCKLDSEERAAA